MAIWNYFRGYVIIKASGLSAGKFINMSAFYGVNIWDIENDGKYYFIKADIRDKDELKEISRKSGCRTEIVAYKGLPCVLKQMRRKSAYVFGAFAFVAAIYALSGFVWTVSVEGNYRVSTNDIKNFCRQKGIYPGNLKSKINTELISNGIIAEFEDVGWAAVNIKGTKATISISETIPKIEIIDNSLYCDIISETDGIIESITVINGTPLVRANDVVKKGDVIVSGVLDIKDGEEIKGQKYVKAEAYIRAVTVHNVFFQVDMTENEKKYTGKKSKGIEIYAFEKKIDFSTPFGYDKFDKTEGYSFGLNIGEYNIPFGFKIYNINEYTINQKKLSQQEAEKKAADFLSAYKEEHFGMEDYVLSEDIKSNIKDNKLEYKVTITVSQTIGETKTR